MATWSRVYALVASSFGATRNNRRTLLAIQFSTQISGRTTRDTITSGGASRSAALSGTEKAMFLGTISPNTTWRNVTSTKAMTKATVVTIEGVSPVQLSGYSSRWWIAGSETFKMTNEQTVMPSWLVASINVARSMAHKVVAAARLPAAARGSICERRAEITANSAPTKKALTARRTISQIRPGT